MGFLDFLKNKKEVQDTPETIEVHISELENILQKKFYDRIKQSEAEVYNFKKSIVYDFEELEKLSKKLDARKFSEQDGRINTMANMTKSNYVKTILNASKTVKNSVGGIFDLESHMRIKSAVNDMKNIPHKQAYFLSNFFREDMKAIVDKIKKIDANADNFEKYLKSEGAILDAVRQSSKKSKDIMTSERNISDLSNKISDLKQSLEIVKMNFQQKSSDLNKTIKSEEKNRIEASESEIKDLISLKDSTESEIKIALNLFKRPLEKFLHFKTDDLPSETRKYVESFIHSPFSTFIENENILRVFDDIKKNINILEIKDSDRIKLENFDVGQLSEMKAKYSELLVSIDRKKANLESISSDFLKKKSSLENDLKLFQNDIKECERKIRQYTSNIEDEKSSVIKNKSDLEEMLVKYTVSKFLIKI